MSHLGIHLNHSILVTSILDLTACHIWFGEWHCAFILLSLILLITQIVKWEVYLHLGTYSLDVMEGMVYSPRIEKMLKVYIPLVWGIWIFHWVQEGHPACHSWLFPSSTIGPSSTHSLYTGVRNLEMGSGRMVILFVIILLAEECFNILNFLLN